MAAGLIGVHFYREANRPAPLTAKPEPVAEKPAPRLTVPMVSRTLAPGQIVSLDDVALVKLTRERMTELGITKAYMAKPEQIIGKTVRRELRRGSTFDTRDFYPRGQGPGIAHRLKPGLRAITIAMLPTNALIGFAGAGQSVDVLFHYGHSEPPISSDAAQLFRANEKLPLNLRAATSTLIQDAEILAFNKQTNEVAETKDVPLDQRVLVTLAVFPREAELLRLASGHGELSLTLRSPADNQNVPVVSPRTLDEIIDVDEGISRMEIFRGNRISQLQFDSNAVVKKTRHDGGRDSDESPSTNEMSPDRPTQSQPNSDPGESAPTTTNGRHFTGQLKNSGKALPASYRGGR